MLGIYLLGPVRATSDALALTMSRPLERALLARLALARGETVDSSRLLDDLWNDPDTTASAALHTLVYRLRRTLGPEGSRIVRSGGGYSMQLDAAFVDLFRFEELAARGRAQAGQGDPAGAAEMLATALALCCGPVLSDIGDVPFAIAQRAALTELRLAVFEHWVQACLDCSRHDEVIGELEAALAEQPLREALWGKLMLALYRSGRQADSLAAYQRLRVLLAEELGVDPCPPLAALHQAVLEQSPSLLAVSAAAPVPGTQKPEPEERLPLPGPLEAEAASPFVGRISELDLASRFLGAADDGRLTTLWILGEPGIGKTRLAAEIAKRLHAQGGVALFGRCSEDVAVPYQPFLEALQWYVARLPDLRLAERLGASAVELARLLPDLERRLPGLGLPRSATPDLQQHRLFEAVRSWLNAAGGGRPLVLVLDDLQWASRSTLALVRHLALSGEPSGVVLVGTARDTAPDENQALARLIDELHRHAVPGATVALQGLGVDSVSDWVGCVDGEDRPARARRIHAETAGNPLLINILLSTSSDGLHDPSAEGATLVSIVDRRLDRLPAEVGELLRTAAVAGERFDLPVLALASRRDEQQTLGVLELAQRAGLIEELAVDSYRFRHALVRSALREQLSRSMRARIHLQVAEALETAHSRHLDRQAAALAFHFWEAQGVGGAAKAYDYALLQAEEATRVLSYDEAVASYLRALNLFERASKPDRQRGDLLLLLGESQRRAGDLPAALETFRAAAEQGGGEGDSAQLAKSAVAFEETSYWLGHSGAEASVLLAGALQTMPAGDPVLAALTSASYSRALSTSGRARDGIKQARKASALAERLDDARSRFAVAFRTSPSSLRVENANSSAARWMQLAATAEKLGDEDSRLFSIAEAMWAVAMLGDMQAWDHLFAEYSSVATKLKQPRWSAWLESFRAFRALLAADLKRAELHLELSQRVATRLGTPTDGLYGVAMYLIRREQGRLPEVLPFLQAVSRLDARGAVWRPGLAAIYAELGRLDDALAVFEELVADGMAGAVADGTWDLSVGFLAEVCIALEDAKRAPMFSELLRPGGGRFLAFLGCAAGLGPVDRLLGGLARVDGRPEEASSRFRSALELARNMESPLWTARCLRDYGMHMLPADPLVARRMMAEARSLCEQHGLAGLASDLSGIGN